MTVAVGYPYAPPAMTVTDKLATVAPAVGNVAGYYVWLGDSWGNRYGPSSITDAGGNWSLPNVPAGAYEVFIGTDPTRSPYQQGAAPYVVNPLPIWSPAATDASIRAAALSAFNAGGGTVQLPPCAVVGGLAVPIALSSSLPIYSGVVYVGTSPTFTATAGNVPTGSNNALNEIQFTGGTVLAADPAGSFYIFSGNTTDYPALGSWPSNLGALYLYKAGFKSIGATSCAGLIKVGGMNNVGLAGSTIMDDLWVNDWTDWAYWFANCGEIAWGALSAIFSTGGTTVNGVLRGSPKGIFYYAAKGQNAVQGIPGDGTIQNIFGFNRRDQTTEVPRITRGVVIEALGSQGLASNQNGFSIFKIGCNNYKPGDWTATASFTLNSPTITLGPGGSGAALRVGMPVTFATTGAGFNGVDANGSNPLWVTAGGVNGGFPGGGTVFFIRWPGLKVGDPLPGDQILLSASRNSVAFGEKWGTFTYTDATHIVYTAKGNLSAPIVGDWFIVGEDANGELVKVTAVSGGGPYTLTVTAMTKAHPAPNSAFGLFAMSVIAATATSTATLQTRGFSNIEIGAGDPASAVSNVVIDSLNADGTSEVGYYFESGIQCKYYVTHEEPTGTMRTEIVGRNLQNCEIRSNQPIATDFDATCDLSSFYGSRHGNRNRNLRGAVFDDAGAFPVHRTYDFPMSQAYISTQDAGVNYSTAPNGFVGDGKSGYFLFDTTGPVPQGNRVVTFQYSSIGGVSKIPLLKLWVDPHSWAPLLTTWGGLDWDKILNGPPVALSTQSFAIYFKTKLPAGLTGIKVFYELSAGQ